jgi:hypothetical protein
LFERQDALADSRSADSIQMHRCDQQGKGDNSRFIGLL